jgi:hypothetical protein
MSDIKIGEMVYKIIELKNAYKDKHNLFPNAIFFGRKEYRHVMMDCYTVNYCITGFKTFMGMEIVKVSEGNYLKVGFIEG